MQPHHISITSQYNAQFLPGGRCELVEGGDFKDKVYENLFQFASNTEQIILEKDEEVYLVSKITPMLHLEIAANRKTYNIGILKNVSKRLTEELRNRPLVSSK